MQSPTFCDHGRDRWTCESRAKSEGRYVEWKGRTIIVAGRLQDGRIVRDDAVRSEIEKLRSAAPPREDG